MFVAATHSADERATGSPRGVGDYDDTADAPGRPHASEHGTVTNALHEVAGERPAYARRSNPADV